MAADGGGGRNTYWATREAGELSSALRSKERAYYAAAEARGLRRMWEIAFCQYYGLNPGAIGDMATQSLAFVGASNEFIRFRINEVRSFIKQEISMSRGERPAFKCVGMNTDYQSLAQVGISDQVVRYLYQTGTAEDMEQLALEGDGVFGQVIAHIRWDYEGGDEVDVELPHPTGMMVPDPEGLADPYTGEPSMIPATIPSRAKSGMPTATICYPWEVIREPYARGKHLWSIVKERDSKWNLAGEYPELHDQIVALTFNAEADSSNALFGHDASSSSEDDVIVRHFYHAPCKAIPGGRYVGMVGDIILWDEGCPLPDRIPLVELCSAKYIGTAFGYSDAWDLIGIQQMIDQLCSDGASNFAKFGRPMIVADEGLNLDAGLLSRGHQIWTKPTEAAFPQAISFAAMPPGFMDFLTYLHSRHQSISGLNSTVRGDPDKNITSGTMAALFHSIAIEFRSAEALALNSFRKDVANTFLDMVRMNAAAPFVAEISGHSERPFMKQFDMQDVSGIKRVIVEPVSSLSQSTAGRMAIAELLMQIPDPQQRAALLKGVETGQWGDFTRKERNADLRVQFENEKLAQGIPCRVLSSDDPFVHIPQHLADIDARTEQLDGNPGSVDAQLEHVLEHLMQYQMINPNMARVLKIPLPLPVQGTPTGDANMMLTGPVDPVPAPGEGAGAGAVAGAAKASGAPQGRDPSGVKLPNPAQPPPGSAVAA